MADVELGPKMLACSERERAFVWAFLENGGKDAAAAARAAGCKDPGPHSSAIRVRGHELRYRPRVIEAMNEVGRKHFSGLFVRAVSVIQDTLDNEKNPGRLAAAFSVLSRLGLGERTGVDVNVSGEVEVNHTDAALDGLRLMRQMGVPRAKQEEFYGVNGLPRLEKMLAIADARSGNVPRETSGPVIEHEP